MAKDKNTKLDTIVDEFQKRSQTQLSSTLAQLRSKLREEQNELANRLGVSGEPNCRRTNGTSTS